MHNTQESIVTSLVILAGGWVATFHPEAREWCIPIISAFAGSWLRQLPGFINGNGNGNGTK